jgi:hypothetical protein
MCDLFRENYEPKVVASIVWYSPAGAKWREEDTRGPDRALVRGEQGAGRDRPREGAHGGGRSSGDDAGAAEGARRPDAAAADRAPGVRRAGRLHDAVRGRRAGEDAGVQRAAALDQRAHRAVAGARGHRGDPEARGADAAQPVQHPDLEVLDRQDAGEPDHGGLHRVPVPARGRVRAGRQLEERAGGAPARAGRVGGAAARRRGARAVQADGERPVDRGAPRDVDGHLRRQGGRASAGSGRRTCASGRSSRRACTSRARRRRCSTC